MRSRPFLVLTGAAAAMGGTARIAAIFTTPIAAPQTLAWFYFAIDVLLMLGLAGWYVLRAERLGHAGLIGFVIALSAILLIRSADQLGATYRTGASMLAVGLAVMSAAALLRGDKPLLAPTLWLLCLVSGVVAFAFAPAATAAFVLFGLGYVAAGVELLRSRT